MTIMPIAIASDSDVPVLVSLMNCAYRGEGSKQGWTSEADLFIGNHRTDETSVTTLMKKPGAVFLKHLNEEGVLDGCVFLHKKGQRLYLGMLSVSPFAQGKGIGKKLLTAADEFAREQQCSSIYMTVITVRDELIAWYERNGYQKTEKIIPFPVDERYGVPTRPLEMIVLEKWVQR
jgi:ribosomal protein S18 acetylase RimI-like enzyme